MESNSTDSDVSENNLIKSKMDKTTFEITSESSVMDINTLTDNNLQLNLLTATSTVGDLFTDSPQNAVPFDLSTQIGHLSVSSKPDNDNELGATGGMTAKGTLSDSEDSKLSDEEEIPDNFQIKSEPEAVQFPQDKPNEDDLKVPIKHVKLFDCDPDVSCKLCGEPYQDPRILPCLHSFCCQCIMKLKVVASKQLDVSHVVCPVCKEKAKVNTEEESLFNINPLLANRIKLGQVTKGEAQCVMCKIRSESNPASGFCMDCEDMLCKDCCEKHTYSRVTVNHKIISIEELSKEEYNFRLMNRQAVMCPAHEHEELKFYCSDCSVGVCRDCIILHHQNHICHTSQEAADKMQSELKHLMIGIRQKQKMLLNDDIEKFSLHIENLELLQEAEIEKVTTVTKNLIDLLNAEKQIYHEQIKKQFSIIRNKCEMRKDTAEKKVKKMEETLNFTTKLLKDGKPEEIIGLAHILRHRAVTSLNDMVQPEPITWFSPPSVHINNEHPKTLSEVNFPYVKVMPATKCYDPIRDMKIETSLKEILEMRGQVGKQMSQENGQVNSQTDIVSSGSSVVRLEGIDEQTMLMSNNKSSDGSSAPVDKGAKPKKKKNENLSEITAVMGRDSPSSIKMTGEVEPEKNKQKKRNKKTAKAKLKAAEEKRTLITMNPNNLSFYHGAPVVVSNTPGLTSYGGASNFGNMTMRDRTAQQQQQIQQNLVSIQYLYNIDTRVKGETEIPNLTAVHGKHNSQVIVTDSNNNKIKIFDKDGQLQDQIETVRPTSVAVIQKDYLWCSESTVHYLSFDKSFSSKINFQKTEIMPHPIAWHKGNDVIIGNGNQIRRYKIDRENKNLKKMEIITPLDIYGNPLCNIFNIRSHKDGRIISVDWNLKAVVITGADGNCTGQYFGNQIDGYMDKWLPGGVCFDTLQGHIFVTDYNGDRLLLLHGATGHLLQEWSVSPKLSRPWGIYCSGSGASGHLYLTGNDPFVHVFKYSFNR